MAANAVNHARPMTLADFTCEGLVSPLLRGREATSVMKELSELLGAQKRVLDVLQFYQAVLNREFMVSTDTEAGIAFPHARVAETKRVTFALGRSDKPISWGGLYSARAVQLVFLLAIPATDSTQYLLLVSGLTRLAKDANLVARMLSARDAIQMLEVLQEVKLRAVPISDSLLGPAR